METLCFLKLTAKALVIRRERRNMTLTNYSQPVRLHSALPVTVFKSQTCSLRPHLRTRQEFTISGDFHFAKEIKGTEGDLPNLFLRRRVPQISNTFESRR